MLPQCRRYILDWTPHRCSRASTTFRRAASPSGADPVRTRQPSSPSVTARTQCRRFSMAPHQPPQAGRPHLRSKTCHGVPHLPPLLPLPLDLPHLADPRPVQIAGEGRRGPEPSPLLPVSVATALCGRPKPLPRRRLGTQPGAIPGERWLVARTAHELLSIRRRDRWAECPLGGEGITRHHALGERPSGQDSRCDAPPHVGFPLTLLAPAPGRPAAQRRRRAARPVARRRGGPAAPCRRGRWPPPQRRDAPAPTSAARLRTHARPAGGRPGAASPRTGSAPVEPPAP